MRHFKTPWQHPLRCIATRWIYFYLDIFVHIKTHTIYRACFFAVIGDDFDLGTYFSYFNISWSMKFVTMAISTSLLSKFLNILVFPLLGDVEIWCSLVIADNNLYCFHIYAAVAFCMTCYQIINWDLNLWKLNLTRIRCDRMKTIKFVITHCLIIKLD